MSEGAVAKNLRVFRIAVASHDRENPSHPPAYGIEMSPFDLDRLGFDEGEELWSGVTIHSKEGRQPYTFRTLCDYEEPRAKKAESEFERRHLVDARGGALVE
jgi:hypothetical protein